MEGSGKGRRHFPPVSRRVETSLSVKAANQVSLGYTHLNTITKRIPQSRLFYFPLLHSPKVLMKFLNTCT